MRFPHLELCVQCWFLPPLSQKECSGTRKGREKGNKDDQGYGEAE